MDGVDEKALIEGAKDGDRSAQEALVRRYEGRVYGLVMRIVRNQEDARDVLQETMVKALTSLHRYDPTYAFRAWLFRIATNTSLDLLRKRKMEFRTFTYTDEQVVQDIPSGSTPADERLARQLDWELVERCMARLDTRYSTVLFMRYKEDLPYGEIADALSIPMGTVKVLIYRGREELKRLVRMELKEEGSDR
jgi:RNA polymerase sigma-70 factor (ECF subfamily)